MNCSLISLSKPSATTDCDTAEQLIAYCARVSAPNNQNKHSTADKLIQYLIKNDHWSPLEMCNMTLEINTTRDIARQILRHRSFSFQEFSTRYSEVDQNAFVYRECRLQDKKNRQNSIETDDILLASKWKNMQERVLEQVRETYNWALENGIAKEQARSVLPEGMTPSKMYMQGSIRSWLHYCLLRMSNGTQKEHQLIAKEIWIILGHHFPNIVKIFDINKVEIAEINTSQHSLS